MPLDAAFAPLASKSAAAATNATKAATRDDVFVVPSDFNTFVLQLYCFVGKKRVRREWLFFLYLRTMVPKATSVD